MTHNECYVKNVREVPESISPVEGRSVFILTSCKIYTEYKKSFHWSF
jgi:hypothetical protein